MQTDNHNNIALSRRIEDGQYYRDAREWYHLIYTVPITQRSKFIFIASIGVFFMAMSMISILNLLPISPKIAFGMKSSAIDVEYPSMIRFRNSGESINNAMMRFYLSSYIQKREGYTANKLLANRAFIVKHSIPEVAETYLRSIDQNNPKSPIRIYGQNRDLQVIIHAVTVVPPAKNEASQTKTAQINFSTVFVTNDTQQKTDRTAIIRYEYTELNVRNRFDEALGNYKLDLDHPTFKVLSYDKQERLVQSR